ncbi:SCO2524 family protein [Actinocorallia aurantiaca]|uniref:SCO2524 family protein n=1 Tax=Actinocorallia aurantiaca TaxID=46204 RepID=A0ABN3U8H3_9ACTN
MRIQPRQQIIDIWTALVRSAMQDGKWSWGGRVQPNSISDAEQLLCIMYPASVLPYFKVDLPDETSEDVALPLAGLGNDVIPQMIVDLISEYLEAYTGEDGTPLFGGGSYFHSAEEGKDPTSAQLALNVVDSFSMSVSLMLSTIGFLRTFRSVVRDPGRVVRLESLEQQASKRLTAAMVGLLRSFTVNAFLPDSPQGLNLLRSVNQADASKTQVADDLHYALREVRASVRDFTIGSGQTGKLENTRLLFEVGWSWGVVKDAPPIDTPADVGRQPEGYAQDAPFLYFTVNALDGIADLFSPRTVVLRLLDEEQQRLAQALRLRWQLTQNYWSAIATFGDRRWPLEDIPWRTTDGEESDYYSLLITSMVVQELESSQAPDDRIRRLSAVLEELAQRGRITRRATTGDWGVRFHSPGTRIGLVGTEKAGGPPLLWQVYDYSAVLLKRTLQLAELARNVSLQDKLIALTDQVWDHLLLRQISSGPSQGLWDQPGNVYPQLEPDESGDLPSWYLTERIIECMVVATELLSASTLQSPRLFDYARDLLNEADRLYDYEVLKGLAAEGGGLRSELERARRNLIRARELLSDRPGTSVAIAMEVLRFLDQQELARKDADRHTIADRGVL